jgi:exonuclease SbcC
MITRFRLKHFQRHIAASYTLERITTFVGPSDAGKSSIIRALGWLFTNRPSGLGFLTQGQTEVKVQAEVDGEQLLRAKSATENLYNLSGANFRSFGTGVPQPVEDLLRLAPASIQSQFEPHYWLSLNPPSAASELNTLADLETLETCQAKAAAALRSAKLTAVNVELQRERAAAEVKRLEPLRDAEKQVETLVERRNQLDSQVASLNAIQAKIDTLSQIHNEGKQLKAFTAELRELVNEEAAITEARAKVERLTSAVNELRTVKHLAEADWLPTPKEWEELGKLRAHEIALKENRATLTALNGLIRDLRAAQTEVDHGAAELRTALKVWGDYKQGAETCPKCGKPL